MLNTDPAAPIRIRRAGPRVATIAALLVLTTGCDGGEDASKSMVKPVPTGQQPTPPGPGPNPADATGKAPTTLPSDRVQRPADADAALAALQAGNARFVAGKMDHPHSAAAFRAGLEQGQHPFVTVVGCSDSRVPPELIFDEGFGDLFVVRVAGNVVDTDVAASVEYGVDHLHTPLVVVLGHEHCGAVTAAVTHLRGELPGDAEPPEILALLGHIEPGLQPHAEALPLAQEVHGAVEDNVRHSIAELSDVPDVRSALDAGRVRIVGAVYDLASGRVRYLPASPEPHSAQMAQGD